MSADLLMKELWESGQFSNIFQSIHYLDIPLLEELFTSYVATRLRACQSKHDFRRFGEQIILNVV